LREGQRETVLLVYGQAYTNAEAAALAGDSPDGTNLAEGASLFQEKCAVCHAFDSGPTMGANVYPRAPALRAVLPTLVDGQISAIV
jgi:mono/diheme cytochrome c family protein